MWPAGAASGLGEKLWLMVTDHWPVLMGYDTGYGPLVERCSRDRLGRRRGRARRGGVDGPPRVARAVVAARPAPPLRGDEPRDRPRRAGPRARKPALHPLPHVRGAGDARGRPRRGGPWRRPVLFLLIATGALASFAQVPGTLRADARWRQFVADMEREGVRYCYTDFFLATRVNFLSGERIVCTAKLGPSRPSTSSRTASGSRRRPRRRSSPSIAPRPGASRRQPGGARRPLRAARADEAGAARLSRKVDPQELFPGREFPMR